MKQISSVTPWLFAAILAGCGGGSGNSGSTASTITAATNTDASSTPAGTTDGGSSTSPGETSTPTQFFIRATAQGDERVYQITDTYSDGTTVIYTSKTVQTAINPDESGERKTFDASNNLVEVDTQDANGIFSRLIYPDNVTCSHSNPRRGVSNPVSIGQSAHNSYTDNCSNGYATVVDENVSIVAYEPITVNGSTHNTLKKSATASVTSVPPSPGTSITYAATRTGWVDPILGLSVKDVTTYVPAIPPATRYKASTVVILVSYVNK